MRSLGLDIGDKRIGVALSDPEEILASPLTTIVRADDKTTLDAIVNLIDNHQVQRVVVGLPYSLDGSIGSQANKVMSFIEQLSKYIDVDIEVLDERLSTVTAENLLIEAGIKSEKRKERRDAAAAAVILQGYLDSRKTYD